MDLPLMREEIFRLRPAFGNVVQEWKDRTWLEYYSQEFPQLREPTDALLSVIESEVEKSCIDASLPHRARTLLSRKKWISTADHHGLLNHAYFYGSNCAQYFTSPHEKVHMTLSFGNVSLGNDSFPRGFFFHNERGELERFFFKSLQDRGLPISVLPSISRENFKRECDRMQSVSLSVVARERLMSFLTHILETPAVWDSVSYSHQLSVMNEVLWKDFFGDPDAGLAYLEAERVAKRLLIENHFKKQTPLHDLLFNSEWRNEYRVLFDGIQGAHTGEAGTHFFWYADHKKRKRQSLFIVGDTLKTPEGNVTIPLTPAHLEEALADGALVLGTALTLLTLCEENLACGGGVSQPTYLAAMIRAWNAILARMGVPQTNIINTSILAGEFTLFGLQGKEKTSPTASFIDVLIHEPNPHARIREALEITPIGDTIDAMIPELYTLITRQRVMVDPSFSIPAILVS